MNEEANEEENEEEKKVCYQSISRSLYYLTKMCSSIFGHFLSEIPLYQGIGL
jgi:hypothetical protein